MRLRRRFVAFVFVMVLSFSSQALAGRAPDFTLKNLDGERVRLYDLLKKGPVIVDFWATWCRPCIKAFPQLEDIYKKYHKQGLQVLAVSVDSPRSRSHVKTFIKSKKYTFEVLLDTDGRVAKKYQVSIIPRTFLIDQTGKIVYSSLGYRPTNHGELEKAVLTLLKPLSRGGDKAGG